MATLDGDTREACEQHATREQPRFVLVTGKLSDIDVGRRSAPTLIDLDSDGLLDLVVGREDAGGQIDLLSGGTGGGLVFYRSSMNPQRR